MKRAAALWRSLAGAVAEQARALAMGRENALHDLRVACRRLEVALRLWGGRGAAHGARLQARKLRRIAAPEREGEVLRSMLRDGAAGAKLLPEDLRLVWLAELGGPGALTRLPRASAARLSERVERAALRLERSRSSGASAAQRLRAWHARALAALATALADGGVESLHLARLALKRWRYAEEAVGAAGGTRAAARSAQRVASLRRWQSRLGRLNDRAQLIAFVAARGEQGLLHVPRLEAARRAALAALRREGGELPTPAPRRRAPSPRPPAAAAAETEPPTAGDPPTPRAERAGARRQRSGSSPAAAAR